MGVEGKPLKRLMSIFGIACTGLKAGVNEKGDGRQQMTGQAESATTTSSSNPARPRSSPQCRCESLVPAQGANLLECKVGSGGAPGFFDSANFAGSTAPTWKLTAGIECSGSRLYSEKSSPPIVGSTIFRRFDHQAFFQAATSFWLAPGLLYIAGAK